MLETSRYPALVLNADFTPMSVLPLETWCWENAVHAVMAGRVFVVEEYDRTVRSPSRVIQLPSVIAHREYHSLERLAPYNRANLFVRDNGKCAYCGLRLTMDETTVDHVLPKSRGGRTAYDNCVASCDRCNLTKANRTPQEAGLRLIRQPHRPTLGELNRTARKMNLAHLERVSLQHESWRPYLAA